MKKLLLLTILTLTSVISFYAHPDDKYLDYDHNRTATTEFTITIGHKSKGTERVITIKNGETRHYWRYRVEYDFGVLNTFYIDDNNNKDNEFVTGADWAKMMENTIE